MAMPHEELVDIYLQSAEHCASENEWNRLRNYEIESQLEDAFGGTWAIDEPCPKNGVFSRYGDLHPETRKP